MGRLSTVLVKIVIACVTQSSLAVTLDGTQDQTFDAGGLDDWTATDLNAVAVQSDGKILIGGRFDDFEETGRENVARLNRDGSLDTSFRVSRNISLQGGSVISEIIELPNSNILVVGTFEYEYILAGARAPGIMLLSSTGAVNNTFADNMNSLIPSRPQMTSAHLSSSGKILIGSFGMRVTTPFVELNSVEFLILNQDGTVNISNTPQGPIPITVSLNGIVFDIAEQANGKIILAGSFTTANGETANRMVRLNTDFSVDTSFNASFDNVVTTVSIADDGKIYAGGQNFNVPGTLARSIARLNSDGSFDNSFNNGIPTASSAIDTVIAQANGKVLINSLIGGGSGFSLGVNRLNTNGTVDSSFNQFAPGDGFGVRRISLQNDGRILAVGTNLGNVERGLAVRLDCADSSTFNDNLEFNSTWCNAGHVAFEEELMESIAGGDSIRSGDIDD